MAGSVPFGVLLATWAGALLLTQLMYFVNTWVGAKVDRTLLVDIRQRVHDHLQTLSLDFFSTSRSGELMQRVTVEPAGVQRLLTDCLLPPLIDTVVLVVAIGYLVAISWQMTVAALVLTPLALITLRIAGRGVQAAMRRVMNADRAMAAELEQTINGMAEIQTFNAEPLRSKRFREVSERSAASTANFGGVDAGNGERVTGVRRTQHRRGVARRHRVQRELRPDPCRPDRVHRDGPDDVRCGAAGHGRLHHLSFGGSERGVDLRVARHPPFGPRFSGRRRARRGPRQPGVRGCDVRLRARTNPFSTGCPSPIAEGETVALVGGIGSGKSTVFNLLLRFLDPQQGRILLDGHDIAGVTIASLRDQVSKLAQFPFFTRDTIRENIRLARPDADDADVEEACRQAHVHSVIVDPTKMHDGYDTVMDVQVPSGGQKRLIALARCLLRAPEVLLLDEPTENLDADQRARLTGVIRDYARDRTCVVISHDMDFIAAVADRILVLEHGRIAQEGDHHATDGRGRSLQAAVRGAERPLEGALTVPFRWGSPFLRSRRFSSQPSDDPVDVETGAVRAAPPAWRTAPSTSPHPAAGPRCWPRPLPR